MPPSFVLLAVSAKRGIWTMAPRKVDRIASLAGLTARQLTEIAAVLEECGLVAQAHQLRQLAAEHTAVALDFFEDTPLPGPLPTGRWTPGK